MAEGLQQVLAKIYSCLLEMSTRRQSKKGSIILNKAFDVINYRIKYVYMAKEQKRLKCDVLGLNQRLLIVMAETYPRHLRGPLKTKFWKLRIIRIEAEISASHHLLHTK